MGSRHAAIAHATVPQNAGARADVERPARAPRITYISWAENCSRSDHTARELGGPSHMVYLPRFGSRLSTILFKYAGQWVKTARILRRERPDTVFVMLPPMFAALPAFWYAAVHGKDVVLDAHTGTFLQPRWLPFQWLQRILCRRAKTTLVTNTHLAGLVRSAGGHATLVPDVPVIFPEREAFPRPEGFVVAAVCSFDFDEPVEAMLDAAARLPDVHFFVTGNPSKLPADVRTRISPNVTLTGFISTPAYAGLLTSADVVMVLTTYDHTMSRGAYEAIYQGTPVITSNWQLLRDSFPQGAVHVDNSVDSIVDAVRTMQRAPDDYRAGARRLREAKLARWEATRSALVARIGA